MLQCFSVRRFIVSERAETERFIRRAQKGHFHKDFPGSDAYRRRFSQGTFFKSEDGGGRLFVYPGEDFVRERMIRRKWFGKREPGKFLLFGEYD